ncbi:MAG: HPF/RaiA family ribosome-associated protein [Planctomycetota bacterium]
MQQEPTITFRNMEVDPAIESTLNRHIARLERFHDNIISCRVTIDLPHQRQHHGNLYSLRIDLKVPGDELVVSREQHERHRHEDIHVVIHDAFRAAERLLEERTEQLSQHVKHHESHDVPGRVVRIEPDHGFIEAIIDGHEVYFHRNAVGTDDDWEQLEPGSAVRFIETTGESGPAASVVRLARRASGPGA